MTAKEIIGIVGLVIGLAVLIFLIFKRIHPLIAGIAATLVVGIFNLIEPWTVLTTFANGIGETFVRYLFVIFFATIYGSLLNSTGCAEAIAKFFLKLFGKKSVALVVVLTTGLLVYGGVSAVVVAFTMVPIGLRLIKEANISKKLLPAFIAMGQTSFALGALPGTPQLNNLIPGEYLGTKTTAAPVLGIIAAVIMFTLGILYLQWQVKKFAKRSEGFIEDDFTRSRLKSEPDKKLPHAALAFGAMFLLMGCFFLFDNVNFWGYQFTSIQAINTAMMIAIIYLCVLGLIRRQKKEVKDSIKKGSLEWISPLLNFAIVVGFGSVIQNTVGFNALINAVVGLKGSTYLLAALTVCLFSGVTGSASGGLKITLSNPALVESWIADTSVNLNALHRVMAISSTSLDSLPHCGGILATLDITGETHSSSYKHILIVTVVIPFFTTMITVGLAMLGLTF